MMTVRPTHIQLILSEFQDSRTFDPNNTTQFLDFIERIITSEPKNLSDCGRLLDLVREFGHRWPGLSEEVRGIILAFVETAGFGWPETAKVDRVGVARYVQ